MPLMPSHVLLPACRCRFVQRAMVALPAFRNVDFETLLAVHPRMQARSPARLPPCLLPLPPLALPRRAYSLFTPSPSPSLQRWVRAALARPSLQQTTPSEEAVVGGMRKFVAPWKG